LNGEEDGDMAPTPSSRRWGGQINCSVIVAYLALKPYAQLPSLARLKLAHLERRISQSTVDKTIRQGMGYQSPTEANDSHCFGFVLRRRFQPDQAAPLSAFPLWLVFR
jgi:hypothetical protein